MPDGRGPVPPGADHPAALDRSGRLGPDRRVGRLHVLVDTVALAEAALAGGAPTLQVRVKDGDDRERFAVAAAVVERCRAAGACCIVDDRADMAVAAGADGVHVGAMDLPVDAARRAVGPDLVVGATVRDPAAALQAVELGADYLGVGPTYVSSTKDGLPEPLGPPGIAAVAAAVALPVVAIAGITVDRVPEVLAAGAWGVAVIGAVSRAADPVAATRALLEAVAVAAAEVGV